MKHLILILMVMPTLLFALNSQKRILYVFPTHYLLDGKSDSVVPVTESAAIYLMNLKKGTASYPEKYSCHVKSTPAHIGDVDGGVMYYIDTVFQVSDCVPK